LVGVPYALSSIVGIEDANYFEHVLEPVVARAPEHGDEGATSHSTGEVTHGVQKTPEFLSKPPQPVDSASPLSVGEGAEGSAGGHATTASATHAHSAAEVRHERIFSGISIAIAALGILAGLYLFIRRPLLQMPRLLENKYYVDEVYDAAIINPIKVGSREGLWKIFDVGVVDGLVNGIGRSMAQLGSLARVLQPGFVRSYAAIILFGAVAVIAFFAYSAYKVLPLIR
jgi:NADH-quinone oxidoreductase subunit L